MIAFEGVQSRHDLLEPFALMVSVLQLILSLPRTMPLISNLLKLSNLHLDLLPPYRE